MNKRNAVILGIAAVAGLIGLSAQILRSDDPKLAKTPEIQPVIQEQLDAQAALPAADVAVLQALRVFSSVEMTYFTEKGGYGTVKTLQSEKYLDPAWPRIDHQAYAISCEVGRERLGFECFADPTAPDSNYYYVNPSQTVRFEKGRRPDENSPAFGQSKENQ